MSNADASEVQRNAAKARWTPSPVIARAVDTLTERPDEVSRSQWAQLLAAAPDQDPGDDDE